MPFPSFAHHVHTPRDVTDTLNVLARSQTLKHEVDFLDHPFDSNTSTVLFVGLCAYITGSVWIIVQKYRKCHIFHCCSRCAQQPRDIESLGGISETLGQGMAWSSGTDSDLATASLVAMRQGRSSACEGGSQSFITSPEGALTLSSWPSHHEREGYVVKATTERIEQSLHSSAERDCKREIISLQAGQDQTQGKPRRLGTIKTNTVIVGKVEESVIAQRRRAGSINQASKVENMATQI